MIRDPKGFHEWEAAWQAAQPLDYERRLAWFDAQIEIARALGAWPPADPWEGLEEKLRWIALLHGRRPVAMLK